MSVLESAIGWLAPPHCVGCGGEGRALCDDCTSKVVSFGPRCWRCNSLSDGSKTCGKCRQTGSPSRVYIFTNYEGLAQQLLISYKFGHQRAAASDISRLMTDAFRNLSSDLPDYLIVPVPTATSRIRERGFDHAGLLAKRIAFNLRMPADNALQRLGQARQLGARRDDRLRQLAGNFYIRNPKAIKGRNVLLIDDVLTTGGTLIAATQALRQAGAARMDALLFAKRL